MSDHEREPFMPSRRQFLKYGAGSALGIGLAASGIPLFRGFGSAVGAAPLSVPNLTPGAGIPANPEDRTLVVLQLGGGNDGLNMLIPHTDPAYQQLRPTLGQKVSDVLPISGTLALHPGLKPLVDIFSKGQLAVVEGVEYPHPNFSHFRGTEIWMTADDQNVGSLGWIGHALDHLSNHPALVAASLGVTTPRALVGMQPTDIALGGALKDFVYKPVGKIDPGAVTAIYDYMNSVTSADSKYDKLITASHSIAQDAMAGVAKVAVGYTPAVAYPKTQLGAGLQTVAQMIHGGVGARVLYLATGGFDTHSNERETHDRLMQYLGDSLGAFWQDINAHGHGDNVALMTFSEFGRRPAENASHGTDHGSAAPMFVMGGSVKGGIYGDTPNLTDLDNGNLTVQQDFRQVYAAMLQNWLGFDPTDVLPGGPYQALPLFNS
jgi:uncharacterized protein (DUF1501 family)